MNRLNKLDQNKRYQKLVHLELAVADRNFRDRYVSVLNRIIDKYITIERNIRPKSLFERNYHKN